MRTMGFIMSALLVLTAAFVAPGGVSAEEQTVYVVPIKGEIDVGIMHFVTRSIDNAKKDGAKLIIFEIETPGGRVDYTIDICNAIAAAAPIKTVAYLVGSAKSAGSLISIACDKIMMGPNSTIGSAEPIALGLPDEGLHREKFVAAIKSEFRVRAEAKGYPVRIVEAWVDKELEIKEVKIDGKTDYMTSTDIEDAKKAGKTVEEVRTVNPRGKLLDLTAQEAFHLGICDTVVNSRDEVLKISGISAAKVTTMRMTWAEDFVRFVTQPLVVFVLILAGLIGLVFSLKVPGLGVPEIITAVCFILVFFGHYMAGLATEIEIAMFVLGVVLLVLEIFVIPGFGVTGIAGIALVLASLLLAMQGFSIPKQPWQVDRFTTNLTILLGSFASAIVILMMMVRFLPSVPVLNKLVLKTKLEEKDGVTVAPPDLTDCLGRAGIAITTLRPAGKIMLDGKTVDAVTEGDYIEKGQAVHIVQADGTKIVVRKA